MKSQLTTQQLERAVNLLKELETMGLTVQGLAMTSPSPFPSRHKPIASIDRQAEISQKLSVGVRAYYRKVRTIAKAQGCSLTEARKIYREKKQTAKAKKAHIIRRDYRDYWRDVHTLALANNISISDARKLYKNS
jgi:hypothetical protein